MFGLMFGSVLMFVLYMFIMAGATMVGQEACLSRGYPQAKVTWAFTTYCVKRVDQTDVVVPLSEIRK